MLGRKTRAKRAVKFFTARLALVFFRGIRVAFSLLKSTPQIVGHLVYIINAILCIIFFGTPSMNFIKILIRKI